MPLRIKCPTGHTLIVPDDRAGRTLQCPRCDQPVVVPGGETETADNALLSVLAEGIPAASLAAGSLRVAQPAASKTAPTESRPAGGSLRTIGARASGQPPKLPKLMIPAARPPAVKPKSRVLPAPPIPPPPEPTQPQREAAQVAPVEEMAPMDVPVATPPVATPQAPTPPATTTSAETPPRTEAAVVTAPPEPLAPAVKPDDEQSPLTVAVDEEEAAPAVAESATVAANPIIESVAHQEAAPETSPDQIADHPPAPPVIDDVELPAPPRFVPRIDEPLTASLNADASRTLAAYQLAAALAAAALFSIVPAIWDVVEFLQVAESQFVARWALVLFFLGVVQLAYAVYLFQLPDWTTVWVVTLLSLALAATYAAVLGLVLLSPADGLLIGNHGLQLADKLAGGKAALWCLCMISLTTILAFFAGRLGAGWHKAEIMFRVAAA